MKPNFLALGRMKSGVMNKTETAYAEYLESEKVLGNILWYKFEGIKFRLADSCFFTPDFIVMKSDGYIECHEVKGFFVGDGKTKMRMASELYPFRFIAVYAKPKKEGGGWRIEEF